jgi:ATP diphosphatase
MSETHLPESNRGQRRDDTEINEALTRLLEIMRRLRDPETGCPWDLEQDFASIAPYTVEEAYEVADAIERENWDDLEDELGDLLLQVVFHAQMADERGLFDFQAVARRIGEKLVRRHPHVFGEAEAAHADQVKDLWQAAKAEERRARGAASHLDGVSTGLPELLRASKLQKRAARAGFDWASPGPVLDKLDEELKELHAELHEDAAQWDRQRLLDELGDLLFVSVNLARKLELDPGAALRHANAKFERRFRAMERMAEGQEAFAALDLEAQEALWQRVKQGSGEDLD